MPQKTTSKKKPTKKAAAAAAQRNKRMQRGVALVIVLAIAAVGTYMVVGSHADSFSSETNGAGKTVNRPDQTSCAALKRAWSDGLCQWSQNYTAAPNHLCTSPDLAYFKATPNDFCAAPLN